MSMSPMGGGALERTHESSGLADVVGTILDKGVVIDVFARVSLVGIEVLRIDARIVVASVDTYLRFAEAVNRVELGAKEPEGLVDVVGDITQATTRGIAEGKVKGALDAGLDRLGMFKPDTHRRSPQRR